MRWLDGMRAAIDRNNDYRAAVAAAKRAADATARLEREIRQAISVIQPLSDLIARLQEENRQLHIRNDELVKQIARRDAP